uniref:Uncharacterized protein n=1 Tax=Acrobeloides nanus TaxID=290746 RepID=A0A914EBK3_9BILA
MVIYTTYISSIFTILGHIFEGRNPEERKARLLEAVQAEIQHIPVERITSMVESMPRCIKAMIKARGYATKY